MQVVKGNVGRIAERIVMNELESRGYHIIDLAYTSKTFANVDFIASKGGQSFNVQVKGTSLKPGSRRAVQYGYCTKEIVAEQAPMFNGKTEAPFGLMSSSWLESIRLANTTRLSCQSRRRKWRLRPISASTIEQPSGMAEFARKTRCTSNSKAPPDPGCWSIRRR